MSLRHGGRGLASRDIKLLLFTIKTILKAKTGGEGGLKNGLVPRSE